jgi:hypothetical protein
VNILKREVIVPEPNKYEVRIVLFMKALIVIATATLTLCCLGLYAGHRAADGQRFECGISAPLDCVLSLLTPDAAEAPPAAMPVVDTAPPSVPEPEIRTTVVDDVSGYEIRQEHGGKLVDRWTFDSWNHLPVTIVHRSPCFADERRDCLAIGRHGKTFRYEMLERDEFVIFTLAHSPDSTVSDKR